MNRLVAPALAVLAIAAVAASAVAKTDAAGGPVTVTVGAALQKKADLYGPRELKDLTRWLDETAEAALRNNRAGIVRANLVIEDARPSRPTPSQQSRRLGLSAFHSIGLGGARVSGYVETADGDRKPVDFSWYESDIRNEVATTTWSDASRAFQYLAGNLARGETVDTVHHADGGNGDFGTFNR